MRASTSIGKRLLTLTAALGSVFAVGAASAQTASGITQSPPIEWLSYAETVTGAVTTWLKADTDAAMRMRLRLDAMRPSPEQPTPLMEIRIWIASDGCVTRVIGPVQNDIQAEADMSEIAASALLDPPPSDMPQPLRIGVQIEAAGGAATL